MNNKTPNKPTFETPDARFNSGEFASQLLAESDEWIAALLKHDERISEALKRPQLVGIHALLSLLDFEGGRIAAALEEIAESVDFIAGQPEAFDAPTEHERVVIYRALEADYLNRIDATGTSTNEMDAALLRFKKLAGL
jgi:hypothetical protein